jgi:hypothetical protein
MKQRSALRKSPEPQPARAFLKPGFTGVHNDLWDSNLLFTLPTAQVKVLLLIIRWSTGHQREWCIMGESRALATTTLSRAAFYRAKSRLAEKGIIDTGHTKTGCSCYRLAYQYQSLILEGREPEIKSRGSHQVDPPIAVDEDFSRGTSVCPSTQRYHDKDIKENITTHHQNIAELQTNDDVISIDRIKGGFNEPASSSRKVTETQEPSKIDVRSPEFLAEMEIIVTEIEKTWLTSASPKSSAARPAPAPAPAKPALNQLQTDLVGKLEIVGINRRIAEKLARDNAPEIIQKALSALPARKEIAKPAGWLVEEIRSGGYAAPAAVQADQTRRQVAQARQADNAREEARRAAEEPAPPTVSASKACPPTNSPSLSRKPSHASPSLFGIRLARTPAPFRPCALKWSLFYANEPNAHALEGRTLLADASTRIHS